MIAMPWSSVALPFLSMTVNGASNGASGDSEIAMSYALTGSMVWVALPFIVGFLSYLLPKISRFLALAVGLASLGYSIYHLLSGTSTTTLQVLGSFGVTLQVDALSLQFLLTSALVTTAVVLYIWSQHKPFLFYTQTIILHGSVNAAFLCSDFISLYVALEVISVAAFILMAMPRTHRSMWIGLRYLLVSNTAMLFYLMGAVLVYQSTHSFAYSGLGEAPQEAIALILVGLLTKGGVFISGLWLPQTHAEADTPVSALLSGAVIKTSIFPLVRCALIVEPLAPLIALIGIGTAGLGVLYAITATDTKRTLAASTVSQVGFMLVAPGVAGFYALTHGLAKASLFLVAGNLPSRTFKVLRRSPISIGIWMILAIASLSIAGCPLFAGFEAKALVLKQLPAWQAWSMTIISVGTAIALSKFLFLPFTGSLVQPSAPSVKRDDGAEQPTVAFSHLHRVAPIGFWRATFLLTSGLLIAGAMYDYTYTLTNVTKALVTLGVGGMAYWLTSNMSLSTSRLSTFRLSTFRLSTFRLSTHGAIHTVQGAVERLDNLIGVMGLVLTLLLWMVLA